MKEETISVPKKQKISAFADLAVKTGFVPFALQLIHFYWLTTDVVLHRIYGRSFFAAPSEISFIFIFVDYLEIPALLFGSAFYIHELHKNFSRRNFLLFLSVIIQIYHIFWMTDEVIYTMFFNTAFISMPVYTAWVAILVDYLELSVIADFLRRLFGKG